MFLKNLISKRNLLISVLMTCSLVTLIRVKIDAPVEHVIYKSNFCTCSREIAIKIKPDESTVHWCNEETSLRGENQNVVGYSVYGDLMQGSDVSRYYTVMDKIPKEIMQHYPPGWRMRIYHGTTENQTKERQFLCDIYCKNDHVDLCDVNNMVESFAAIKKNSKKSIPVLSKDLAQLNRMNWRYLPMVDPLVDRMVARDTDSQIHAREADAVKYWLNSQYTFHVMRDHLGHYMPIMGGMFGAKVYQQRSLIQGLMKAMIQFGNSEGYNKDQSLLQSIFWPSVKDDAVINDSYFCTNEWNSLPITPYPTQRDPVNQYFVTERIGGPSPKPGECPKACRPKDHQDWESC